MIPKIEGPHIQTRLQNSEGLQSLAYAPSLATELVFGISALGYPTESEAVAVYDAYIDRIMPALDAAWYAETYRPLTYGQPNFPSYYNPAYGVGGRLVVAPRLADPRDIGSRIAAYEVLCAALERPDVAFTALPLVDWVTMPIIRDWQHAAAIAALSSKGSGSWRDQYDVAMSGHWVALRGLRGGLLGPWFAGARATRNRELFTALHAGLPDDLAYLALSVANGASVTIDGADALLAALAAEAQSRKLVRLVDGNWHANETTVYRSRRVAIKVSDDEPLVRL
jgi:hypothetical protein